MKRQSIKTRKTQKKQRKVNRVCKLDVFQRFVSWMALPQPLREPENQGQFAKKFRVDEDTLTNWKKRDDFWEQVKKERGIGGREKTSNVVDRWYQKLMRKGESADIKLWLQFFEDWRERSEHTVRIEDIKSWAEKIAEVINKYEPNPTIRNKIATSISKLFG